MNLHQWLSATAPAGFFYAFRSGALHAMLGLAATPSPNLQPAAAAAWAYGHSKMTKLLEDDPSLSCPACKKPWRRPPRPLPRETFSLRSWVSHCVPAGYGSMNRTAFHAGAQARFIGAPRSSCSYDHAWRNSSQGARLADLWRSAYDLLDSFLAAGGNLHCPCCWRPWRPEPADPNTHSKHPLAILLVQHS